MSASTFTLPPPNASVRVSLPPSGDLGESELLAFPAFKTWLGTLTHSLSLQRARPSHPFHARPYTLRAITVQSVDRFGGGARLGFVKLQAEVRNEDGDALPGSVFLRGGAVAMMVVLRVEGTAERYVLMTRQARVPIGSLDCAELPAGMLDDAGSFAGAAAKEIREELGIEIPESDLTDLTALAADVAEAEGRDSEGGDYGERLQKGFYTSGGGSDEFIAVFHHERAVERGTIEEWKGRLTGLRDEGEKITLKVVPLGDLWWEGRGDSKALAALALYTGLKAAGKMS